MSKKNPMGYVEWRSKEPERLGKFYADAFKWKYCMDDGYGIVDFGAKNTHAGILKLEQNDQRPVGVSNYITVKNIAKAEDRIRQAGGKIQVSNQEVPGIGFFSFFTDPDGNLMAIWRELTKSERKQAKKAAKAAKDAEKQAARAQKEADKAARKQAEKQDRQAKKAAKAERQPQTSQPS